MSIFALSYILFLCRFSKTRPIRRTFQELDTQIAWATDGNIGWAWEVPADREENASLRRPIPNFNGDSYSLFVHIPPKRVTRSGEYAKKSSGYHRCRTHTPHMGEPYAPAVVRGGSLPPREGTTATDDAGTSLRPMPAMQRLMIEAKSARSSQDEAVL